MEFFGYLLQGAICIITGEIAVIEIVVTYITTSVLEIASGN